MKQQLKDKIIETSAKYFEFLNTPQLELTLNEIGYENFIVEFPAPISDTEIPGQLMIGKQAEKFFQLYIENSTTYELLAQGIQIFDHNRTIGELDYIVNDVRNNEHIHIELAFKYYLYDPKTSDKFIENWVGPNKKDTLSKKIEKLRTHQFPLLKIPEALDTLSKLKLNGHDIKQKLCLKTSLFLPRNYDTNNVPVHFLKCVVGYWIYLKDFIDKGNTIGYAVPKKVEWLFPASELKEWYSFEVSKQIITEKVKNEKSVLVYRKTPNTIERFFVVWWN